MNRPMPLVSCIIPSYKRNDMIMRAIDSVLAQTYSNIEILVVDDNEKGSDYSIVLEKIVNRYNDERVKLLKQSRHINGAAARNFGIRLSNGEYIAFLDDDDEWLPTKLEKQINFLANNQEYNAVSTLSSVYAGGKLIYSQKEYNVDNLQLKVFLREVDITTPTFLASKQSLVNMGAFDEALLRHQDLQLFVAYLEKYKIGLLPEVLIKIHSDSEINRPNVDKLIQIKRDYFKSVDKYIKKYSKSTQRRIICNHNFEIAYVAFKERKYFLTLKYLFKSGISFSALKDLCERIKRRN